MSPSSKEYKPPQLLGDEQSRLIRVEEVMNGTKDIMSELRDEMKSINRQLSKLEENRAVSEVQTLQNAKDIIELQTDLKVACTKINDVQAELKGYKLTAKVLHGIGAALFAIAFSCVGWVFVTIISLKTQQSINTSTISRVDTATAALNQSKGEAREK